MIQLITYRERRYRVLFNELLGPAFEDLLLVHRDYVKMFGETKRLLPQDDPGADPAVFIAHLKAAAGFLSERRVEFEPVRDKLRALARSMHAEHLDPEVTIFVQSILNYFHLWLPTKTGSATVGLLGALEYAIVQGKTSPEDLREWWVHIESSVDQLINEQRDLWAQVCEAYVPLKMRAATTG